MKIIIGLFLATLMSSNTVVLAEVVGVSGANIIYATQGNYTLSTQDELDESMADASELLIPVLDQLVIKNSNAKTSFTPLVVGGDSSAESVAAAIKILNIQLPSGYLQTMSLYQSFNSSNSVASNVCEFLVLHELLNEQQKTKMLKLLTQSDVVLNDHGGFYSFNCIRSEAGV